MIKSISGTTASIGAWLFALSSTAPPTATEYPAGSPLCELLHLRRELVHDRFRLHVVEGLALQRDRGKPRSPPYRRLFQFVAQGRDGTERHRLSAQADELQVPQRVD